MKYSTHSFGNILLTILLVFMGNALISQVKPSFSKIKTIEATKSLDSPHGDHFFLRLDVNRINDFNELMSNDRVVNEWAFLPSTVELNRVSPNNPRQYTYTYTTTADLFTTSIKKFENGAWVNELFELCNYDANGNQLSSLWKSWDGVSYVNASKTTWIYSDNHKVLSENKQFWAAGAWTNAEKTTNTYDVNGNLVASLKEMWENGAWKNDVYDLLSYNATNLITGLTRQTYNGNGWINALQLMYDYNTNGSLKSWIFQSWDNNAWLNTYKESYTYNSTNKVILYIGQDWIESSWKNSEKYSYTYNTLGFVTVALGETFLNNAWVNFNRGQYNYNDFGGIQAEVNEVWVSGAWVGQRMVNNTFDGNGNALSCDLYGWSGSNWIQNQDGQIFMPYSYSNFNNIYTGYHTTAAYASFLVGTEEQQQLVQPMSFGPNPAKDAVGLDFSLTQSSNVEVYLYNLVGIEVMKKDFGQMAQGKHHVDLKIEPVNNGVYLIQLRCGENSQTGKIILSN